MSAAADMNTVLTRRQQDVLLYLCKGLRNAEIGALLGISERTVKMYVRQLFDIFEVTNRTELAGYVYAEETTQLYEGTCTKEH